MLGICKLYDFKIKKRLIFFCIIIILIVINNPQHIVSATKYIDTEIQEENSNSSILNQYVSNEWRTIYFCRIKVHVAGANIDPSYRIGLIRYAECKGEVYYCHICGINGRDDIRGGDMLLIRVYYLFGYTYLWWQSWFSESYLGGFAIKCEYKVL